jgi:tRNA threonylcarbamoyladenosine modification (KEOPS) complex  Pcc1 subunit
VSVHCEVHTRKKPCIYAPSIKLFLTQDVARVYLQIKATDVNKNKAILEQILNVCMFETQVLDVLIKVVLDRLKNHISFPLSCPFKKVSDEVMKVFSC